MLFEDRSEAGRLLARRLSKLNLSNAIVIAIPRGGVPLAFEIAKEFKAPFSVLAVRKIGAPTNPEFAIGAITENNHYWINESAAALTSAKAREIQSTIEIKNQEVLQMARQLRQNQPLPSVEGRTAILVDDGLATGTTAVVAAQYLRQKGASKVIMAVPVAAVDSLKTVSLHFDHVVCLKKAQRFFSVSFWYRNFSQVSTDEAVRILQTPNL